MPIGLACQAERAPVGALLLSKHMVRSVAKAYAFQRAPPAIASAKREIAPAASLLIKCIMVPPPFGLGRTSDLGIPQMGGAR